METMTYDYFSPAPQPYSYVGFDGDSSSILLKDGLGAISLQSLENIDPGNNFIHSYSFNAFDAAMTPQLQHSHSHSEDSVSPQPQHLSFGSGIDHDRARRNSSEEKDNNCLTPAQSRRKAQNRAAQRAFRERKEKHVRDLEAKLNRLTTTASTLQSDNERLKVMLQRVQTENEILRATTRQQPVRFALDDSSQCQAHVKVDGRSSGVAGCDNNSLLSAPATWDLLQSHLLYLSGAVDIGEVCERLKKSMEKEEGRPVIEDVGSGSRSGSDDVMI